MGLMKKHKQEFGWDKVWWVLGLLLWVGASFVVCQYVVAYAMHWILGDNILKPVWNTVFAAVVYTLSLLVTILAPWVSLKMKTSREELGLTGLPTWTDIGLAPVGFVVYYVAGIFLMILLMRVFPGVDWEQAQDVGFENLFLVSDKILAFLALVVIAPIAEEIIFRGWLYGKIRAKVPAWVGILAVSVLFGLLHWGWNVDAPQWNVVANVFCMSIVLCMLREITGTIWSGVILHMLKNGLAFYLLFVSGMF